MDLSGPVLTLDSQSVLIVEHNMVYDLLQVKLAYQESELLTLLKKIPLGPAELTVLRERADNLKEGSIKTRGDALLPIFLASFIFDALCLGGIVLVSFMSCSLF